MDVDHIEADDDIAEHNVPFGGVVDVVARFIGARIQIRYRCLGDNR